MKTRLRTCLNAMPLFWKVYGLIVAVLIFVVGLVEFIGEPITEKILRGLHEGFQPWHEAVLWVVSIIFPSLACGYVFSRILTHKLDKIAKASITLSRGNLEAHLPVTGNKKDAFDVLAQSFNEMAGMIKNQRQNERRLLVNISHELRSPLTRISVAADILDRKYGGKELEEITRRIGKEVTRMNEMIALLLYQAKNTMLAPGNSSLVDIGKMLRELADDFAFQGEIANKGIKIVVAPDLKLHGNAPQLERMLGNILGNAMFYTPESSAVSLAAGLQDANIHISIRDFGPGVPDGELGEIFRAFYRVDGSRDRSGGVGLGLALARETAIQHGGNIVALNANPGLCVTVTLPACTDGQNSA